MRSICISKQGILTANAHLLGAFAPNTPPVGKPEQEMILYK